MRAIDKNIAFAFHQNRTHSEGNTSVLRSASIAGQPTGVMCILNGNKIAVRNGDGDEVKFSMCGYPTAVTRSRLNAVLSLKGFQIKQVKGVQMMFGPDGYDVIEINPRRWYQLTVCKDSYKVERLNGGGYELEWHGTMEQQCGAITWRGQKRA